WRPAANGRWSTTTRPAASGRCGERRDAGRRRAGSAARPSSAGSSGDRDGEGVHRGPEGLAPLLEVGELVEAGAGGGQQHDRLLAALAGVLKGRAGGRFDGPGDGEWRLAREHGGK